MMKRGGKGRGRATTTTMEQGDGRRGGGRTNFGGKSGVVGVRTDGLVRIGGAGAGGGGEGDAPGGARGRTGAKKEMTTFGGRGRAAGWEGAGRALPPAPTESWEGGGGREGGGTRTQRHGMAWQRWEDEAVPRAPPNPTARNAVRRPGHGTGQYAKPTKLSRARSLASGRSPFVCSPRSLAETRHSLSLLLAAAGLMRERGGRDETERCDHRSNTNWAVASAAATLQQHQSAASDGTRSSRRPPARRRRL
ncbi:hypothetical protein niasHT_018245 [Heterodera trifolii]|uniref:Uncharacterized protein n=1 Tax=Heterodera trifolii TaxID=157864 RepID=A0ABD2L5A4_9BILA